MKLPRHPTPESRPHLRRSVFAGLFALSAIRALVPIARSASRRIGGMAVDSPPTRPADILVVKPFAVVVA